MEEEGDQTQWFSQEETQMQGWPADQEEIHDIQWGPPAKDQEQQTFRWGCSCSERLVVARWHILLPVQISGSKHIIIMNSSSNIVSGSIV